jgi:tryptophanyl-tRNA synthetase
VVTGAPIPEIQARYDGQGYGPFKDDVAEAVVELLAPIQERYRELRADDEGLRRLLAMGAEKAAAESAPTLARMYDVMGFVRR